MQHLLDVLAQWAAYLRGAKPGYEYNGKPQGVSQGLSQDVMRTMPRKTTSIPQGKGQSNYPNVGWHARKRLFCCGRMCVYIYTYI